MAKPKLALLTSGGDWADASAMVLVLPEGADISKEFEAWKAAGDYHGTNKHFHQWLESRGARPAGDDDIQSFHED